MAAIIQKWRKVVFVGCNHGHLADRKAVRGFFKFVEDYKPDTRVHLGDLIDTAAFRTGAAGTSDENVSLSSDLASGLKFLEDYRPTHFRPGNHDDRLYKKANSANAIVALAATEMLRNMHATLDKLRCQYTTSYSIRDLKSYLKLADILAFHGFFFGENAIRDHAERMRLDGIHKMVHVHTHTAGSAEGRTLEDSFCIAAGSLANFEAMDYAKTRAATLRWNAAAVFGEYSDKDSRLWQTRADKNGNFHLPR